VRAPHRLVLSGVAAVALGLALAGLGDAGPRVRTTGKAPAIAEPQGELAARAWPLGAGNAASARTPDGVSRRAGAGSPVGGNVDPTGLDLGDRAEAAAVEPRDAAIDAPGGAGPGPRVALEPLEATPGRVSAPLRGDDPAAPRRLVLWRVSDGRAARLAEGTSRTDGGLDFPEVLLAGRGELFVTGAGVSADLAARLPADRIPVPAPQVAVAADAATRGSPEQEATR